MTDLIPFLIAAVTAVVSPMLAVFLSRRKAAADVYKTQMEGDVGYAQMARDAWKEVQVLQAQLRLHEKRWTLLLPVMEECAKASPHLAAAVAEIRTLNHLQAIDGRL